MHRSNASISAKSLEFLYPASIDVLFAIDYRSFQVILHGLAFEVARSSKWQRPWMNAFD